MWVFSGDGRNKFGLKKGKTIRRQRCRQDTPGNQCAFDPVREESSKAIESSLQHYNLWTLDGTSLSAWRFR